MIPFGLAEYHPITAKDQSRIHQFGRKCHLGYSLDMHCMREAFGREIFWESWKIKTRQKSMLGDSMQTRFSRRKMVNISCSQSHMEQLSCLEEIRGSENPP